MKRSRPVRGPGGEARRGAAPKPATRRATRARWAVTAAALAAVIAAVIATSWWLRRPAGVPASADPAAALEPEAAYARGLALGQAGHYVESLPYFRRAADAPGGAAWQVSHDYSSALANAALQGRTVAGLGQRVVRSSIERVAMMRESFRQLDIAESNAGAAHDRAFIEAVRGNTLATWGFPLEALECYRRSVALDRTMKPMPLPPPARAQ